MSNINEELDFRTKTFWKKQGLRVITLLSIALLSFIVLILFVLVKGV